MENEKSNGPLIGIIIIIVTIIIGGIYAYRQALEKHKAAEAQKAELNKTNK